MTEDIFLSVIVPVYNDWDRLELCMAALTQQSLPANYYEVLIIDNSSAETANIKLPLNFSIFKETIPGSYAARNKGILKAKGAILVFTDSDCIPQRNWLENICTEFGSDQKIERIGGKIEIFKTQTGKESIYLYEKTFSFNQASLNKKLGASITANASMRRNVFDEVGHFDQNLFSSGDIEWGIRAMGQGYMIKYCPDIVVMHPSRESLGQLIKKHMRIVGGEYNHYFRKFSVFPKIIFISKLLIPPFFILFKRYDRSLFRSVQFFAIRWAINMARLYELMRLMILGYGKARRE